MENLISFGEIARQHVAGEYLAVGDDGNFYSASYVLDYRPEGVMFFAIPSTVTVLGYIKKHSQPS